jgi:hypothetical protein
VRIRLLSLLPLAAGVCPAQITISGATTILIDPREPAPIQRAVRDLAGDMVTVFGTPPRTVASGREAAATTLVVAFEHNLPEGMSRPSGWETLRLEVVEGNRIAGGRARHALVMTGSDVRGTIYAVYEFSRRFLKVDPFYWWTDNPPARRSSVRIARGLTVQQGPPTFRYRGWFLNDEDLFTAWRPGTKDGTGIALEVWERIYETLLRLKANAVIPGTFLFPDEPQMKLATARGLVLSQHHMEPLGLNVYQWPAGVPYTLDRLIEAWRCNMRRFAPGAEVVWTTGLRGRYDNPFSKDAPGTPLSEAGQARLITAAIEKQMEIVRAARRQESNPTFIMNTWMEGTRLVRAGLLKIPAGVHLVWADDGAGNIQDGGLMGPGNGVYYHTAVVGGNANNFTERVPISRIQRELGRAARARATEYLMLNPSDVLPVSLSTRAVMEAGWDVRPWLEKGYSSQFIADWSREQFGGGAGPGVAKYYEAYFEAPARYAARNHFEMGDNFYQQVARDLLLRILRGHEHADRVIEPDTTTPEQHAKWAGTWSEYLKGLEDSCRSAQVRWARAADLAADAERVVPADRRDFFRAHVLAQMNVHRASNEMLLDVALAARSGLSRAERLALVRQAAGHVRGVSAALKSAEYGRWEGFYTRGDWFVNVPLTTGLIDAVRRSLAGESLSAADQETVKLADHYINANTSDVFIRIKAYQGARKVEFCPDVQ